MEQISLEEAINASWNIILGHNVDFKESYSKFSKVYFMATESIKSYLKYLELNPDSKVLSVLSSGDHIFNLICRGITKFDAFDINVLTYFIFNLRRAIALEKRYNDFISANLRFGRINSIDYSLELVKKIRGILPEDVYTYYIELLTRCLNTGAKFDCLYRGEGFTYNDALFNNLYLSSEDNYKKMQQELEKAEVDYHFGDARNIFGEFLPDSFGCILLSNIADYFFNGFDLAKNNEMKLNEFIARYYELLENNGVLINYSFGFGKNRLIYGNIPFEKIDAKFEKVPNCTNQGYYLVRKKIP